MSFRKDERSKQICGRCKRPFKQMPHGYINGIPYGYRCFRNTVKEINDKKLSAGIIDHRKYSEDIDAVNILIREAEIARLLGELPKNS